MDERGAERGRSRALPAQRPAFARASQRWTSEGGVRMSTVDELVARSNRLGADPTTTNYAGGNTSAKGVDRDPATGADVALVWVKGSGGDLGTLTPAGLAVLR